VVIATDSVLIDISDYIYTASTHIMIFFICFVQMNELKRNAAYDKSAADAVVHVVTGRR